MCAPSCKRIIFNVREIERIRKDAGLDEDEMASNVPLRRLAGTGSESRHRR